MSADAPRPTAEETRRAALLVALQDAVKCHEAGDVAGLIRHTQNARRLAEEEPPKEKPTADDPLRGLPRLSRLALLGRDRIKAKADEPIIYTWQDIAVAATIIMLAGGPSGGKTTLLFLLIAARANLNLGEPVSVLGREVAPAPDCQRIVLIEGEHGEASTCRKLVRSCALAGVDDVALDRVIIVARKSVRIGSPVWTEIETMVAAGLVSDIALDTLARVAPADANNEREQVAIFDIVAQTIEAAPPGLAPMVWACAHTRKGEAATLDDVSGSIQRVGQADSVLLVKGEKVGGRTVSSTVTFAKLREEPDDYPAPVTFAIDGTSIRIDAAPVGGGKDAKRDREDGIGARAARLHVKLAMAGDYPRGIAKEALVKLMGGNAVRRRREIDDAAARGWIVNDGPRTPYVLGDEPPPPERPCGKCQGKGEVTTGRKPPGPCFACHGSGESG